jgi:hypothetical protein
MKKVMMILAALLAIVVNSVMTTSCDSYEKESEEEITTNFKKAPKEPEKPQALPALSFKFERIDSVYSGKSFSTSWYAKESTTDTKVYGKLSVVASHSNDGNAVNESEMNKVVDVEYARKNTTYGELKGQVSDYGLEKRVRHSMRIVTKLGDGGTICYLDGEVIIAKMVVRDTLRNFPADSIEFGKAQVKSLRFVGNTTRAAETYVDKNDPRKVEITWSVPVVRIHDKVSNSFNVEVRDTITDYPVKKNDIADVKIDTMRVRESNTVVNCKIHLHFTYKNGETAEKNISILTKAELTVKPEWSMNVSNTSFSFLSNEVVKGRVYTPADMKQDNCTFWERVDEFTTVQSNGTEFISNPYTFKHQSVRYKDEYCDVTFDFADPAFKQVSTKVQKVSETATLEVARLYNTIEVSYLGGRQTAEETVLLNREIEEYLVDDYVDVTTAKKVTTLNKTAWSVDRVKKYSTGREARENALFDVVRVMNLGKAWEAIEDNSNYRTGDYEFKTLNSEKVTETVKGVTFVVYVREKEATSLVQLNKSTQKNTFKVTEGEECVIYFNGKKVYDFGKEEISVKRYGDNLTGGAEKDGYKVYNYVDKVSYTVNGNTQDLSLNGTIKVKKAEPKANDEFAFPAYLGEIKLVRQTTTMNETGTGYDYVLSVQFMSGHVVPGIIEPGSTHIKWINTAIEVVSGTNKFNSAVYTSDKEWVNCTAHDVYTQNYLLWYRGEVDYNKVSFDQAASLNWDNGYKRDGHLTVYTNRYRLEVNDGHLSVTDTVTGFYLGKFGK